MNPKYIIWCLLALMIGGIIVCLIGAAVWELVNPRPTSTPAPAETAQVTEPQLQTEDPTVTDVPTEELPEALAATPLPREDCVGAGWLIHTINKGDSLSYYATHLATVPVFAGLSIEQRQDRIQEENPLVNFDPLMAGETICLPESVLPFPNNDVAVGDANADDVVANDVDEAANNNGNAANAGAANVGAGNGGGGHGNGGGGNGGGGNGGGDNGGGDNGGGDDGGVIVEPPPPAPIITIAASSRCEHGNSGDTIFTVTNTSSISVSASWTIMNGAESIQSGSSDLSPSASADISVNSKQGDFTINVTASGAQPSSSGEDCG